MSYTLRTSHFDVRSKIKKEKKKNSSYSVIIWQQARYILYIYIFPFYCKHISYVYLQPIQKKRLFKNKISQGGMRNNFFFFRVYIVGEGVVITNTQIITRQSLVFFFLSLFLTNERIFRETLKLP